MVGCAKPVGVGRVALDVLDDLDAVRLEQRPRGLGAQAHRLERVEVDHRHWPGPPMRVDDRLRALLAEEAAVGRDVDERRLDDAAGVEPEHGDAGRPASARPSPNSCGVPNAVTIGVDALGDRRRDLAVDRRVVALGVDEGDGVAVRLGGRLEQVDRLLGSRLGGVVGGDDRDRPGRLRPRVLGRGRRGRRRRWRPRQAGARLRSAVGGRRRRPAGGRSSCRRLVSRRAWSRSVAGPMATAARSAVLSVACVGALPPGLGTGSVPIMAQISDWRATGPGRRQHGDDDRGPEIAFCR